MFDAFIGFVLGFFIGCGTVMLAVYLESFTEPNDMIEIDNKNRDNV